VKALVTGGGGFLGSAVVRRLRDRGWQVVSLTRGDYPAVTAMGATQQRGDIADPQVVLEAAAGCDAVLHVAAKAGIWGSDESYYQTNVVGTRNVLEACRTHGVPRLVYTSSPSVVHAGADLEGVDESTPYPEHYEAAYPRTKAEAERMVLAANGPHLATVALRPHLIWGPEDTQLVPRIVERRRGGKLRLLAGPPKLVDTIYIDNAADAHLLALDHLGPGSACAGKVYFISQGEPLPVNELINRILDAAGLPGLEPSVPPGLAVVAGAVLETAHRLLRIPGEPRMTRFLARQLASAHWFDLTAARRDLGYEPAISIDEGFVRLRAWFEQQRI